MFLDDKSILTQWVQKLLTCAITIMNIMREGEIRRVVTLYVTLGKEIQIYWYEGSQSVPIRPYNKVVLRQCKAFGSGEGEQMKSGTKRKYEQGPTALD